MNRACWLRAYLWLDATNVARVHGTLLTEATMARGRPARRSAAFGSRLKKPQPSALLPPDDGHDFSTAGNFSFMGERCR